MSTPTPIDASKQGEALGSLIALTGQLIANDFRRRMAASRIERGDVSPEAFAEADRAAAADRETREAVLVAWMEYGRAIGLVVDVQFFNPNPPDRRERPGS